MNTHTKARRIAAGMAAGGMAVGALLLPMTPASPTFADTAVASTCAVESAQLDWGVKTSFRNYISGSIANGEWQTENGARYETPAFIWDNGTGSFDSTLEDGSISFTGDVHFTGHGGAMRLDISNPEIVFTGPTSAHLVLGMGSADNESAEISYERVVAAKIDLSGYDAGAGTSFEVAEAAVRLTAEGAVAFNGEFGDYVSGEELDTLALRVTVVDCSLESSTAEQQPGAESSVGAEGSQNAEQPAPVESVIEDTAFPWAPIVVGGVALIVVGVTAGMLIAGRKKDAAAQTETPANTDA